MGHYNWWCMNDYLRIFYCIYFAFVNFKHFAHWEQQRHNSKFDKMDLSILVKSPFHSAYFSKSVSAKFLQILLKQNFSKISSKLTRERAQKSWWHNTNMRDVKSKIASPENSRILTCDVVLPNERFLIVFFIRKFCQKHIKMFFWSGLWIWHLFLSAGGVVFEFLLECSACGRKNYF